MSLVRRDSAFRELVIVVAGILIAFGLDAWWQRRRETEEVRADLSAVLDELREDEEALGRYIAWHRRTEVASAAFLGLVEESSTRPIEVPDSIVWGTGFTPSFDPRTGAIEAFVNSGRMDRIGDPALRAGLAGFQAHLTDARDEESRAKAYADLQWSQVLFRSGDVSRTSSPSAFAWRDRGGPPGGAELHVTIQPSVELKNHLARRHLFTMVTIEALESLRGEVSRLIGLTEAELGR